MLFYPLGVNHVLTKSMRDTASVLDLTAGPMPGDAYVIDQPSQNWSDSLTANTSDLRIGVFNRTRDGDNPHPDYAATVDATARLCEELGHRVETVEMEFPDEELASILRLLMGGPTAIGIDKRLAELGRELHDDDLEPFTRMMYDAAAKVSGADVLTATINLETATRMIGEQWSGMDVLLTPTTPQPFPDLGLLDPTDVAKTARNAGLWASLTSPFNATGQPALSLPLGTDAENMPIGVQFIAKFGREDLLIDLGAQIERAQPWSHTPRWPAIDGLS